MFSQHQIGLTIFQRQSLSTFQDAAKCSGLHRLVDFVHTVAVETNGLKVKIENEWFVVVVYHENLKFGDFTLLFYGVRQRNSRKFALHVGHDYFSF